MPYFLVEFFIPLLLAALFGLLLGWLLWRWRRQEIDVSEYNRLLEADGTRSRELLSLRTSQVSMQRDLDAAGAENTKLRASYDGELKRSGSLEAELQTTKVLTQTQNQQSLAGNADQARSVRISMQRELDGERAARSALESELATLRAAPGRNNTANVALRSDLDAATAAQAVLQTELDATRTKYRTLQAEHDATRLAPAPGEVEVEVDGDTDLHARLAAAEAERVTLQADLAGARSAAAALRVDLADARSGQSSQHSDVQVSAESQDTATASAADVARMQRELDARQSRIRELEALVTSKAKPAPTITKPTKPATQAKARTAPKPAVKAATPAKASAPASTLTALRNGSWKRGTTKLGTAGSDHRDDLKEIHGIGPKMERLLNGFGIRSWEQLAAMTSKEVATVDAALKDFPGRIERDEWVAQAQSFIKNGHAPVERPRTDKSGRTILTEWSKGTTKLGTPGANHQDDLKVINGIGPKMESILKSFEVTSWEQLATLKKDDVATVTEALDTFPGRIERDEWVAQAKDLVRRFPLTKPYHRPTRETYLNSSTDDDPWT